MEAMMASMPHPRLRYLHHEIDRHGNTRWYFRKYPGKRIRIRGDYDSHEFMLAYEAARTGRDPLKPARPAKRVVIKDTLAWLIARYHDSAAWARLSVSSRRQREYVFNAVVKSAGDAPVGKLTKKTIKEAIDRRRTTPAAANSFLNVMGVLFRWGLEAELIDHDPTEGVRGLPGKTEGYHTWTEEEIAQFERRWPVGSRERLALAILLYTGFRCGDAAIFGRQHIQGSTITLRTEKTKMTVVIPLFPELASILNLTKMSGLAFICGKDGQPLSKNRFGTWFTKAAKAAGISNGTAHGLRKAAATRAVNNGATLAQLEAFFGWSGGKMASVYTKKADRARLAQEIMIGSCSAPNATSNHIEGEHWNRTKRQQNPLTEKSSEGQNGES
jgi:integrase